MVFLVLIGVNLRNKLRKLKKFVHFTKVNTYGYILAQLDELYKTVRTKNIFVDTYEKYKKRALEKHGNKTQYVINKFFASNKM